MKKNKNRGNTILHELKHHLPFTLTSSIAAGILVAIFYLINKTFFVGVVSNLFEIMHPAHVFVSAMATAAIYNKYKKSIPKSIFIGMVGAILIGSLSDVIFPWVAGNLFSLHTHFHLPIIEKTFFILGVAGIGAAIGSKWNLFNASHSVHVFISIFASLFYLLTFSVEMNPLTVMLTSLIIFLAVYIPCCISDIIFPLLFVKK
ncbi:hypothetical protein KAS08_01055 [Candidatus Pacearchaeota archaeon]|nr:hypothetical protein [Candidatus Pacearchaeota archaeon]